jgi:hypothetical protein
LEKRCRIYFFRWTDTFFDLYKNRSGTFFPAAPFFKIDPAPFFTTKKINPAPFFSDPAPFFSSSNHPKAIR